MPDISTSVFNTEAEFEEALISYLTGECGWEKEVLKYPTEDDLIENWRKILCKNNLGVLNGQPLTSTEMDQIIDQVRAKNSSPFELNSFINGGSVCIKRDNPADKINNGEAVYLHIYKREEIAAGRSIYQIVQQPKFRTTGDILSGRRGDIMLLINGMPVFHIELKRSSRDISSAYNQIQKYSDLKVFTGIFSMVQIFVCMKPDDCLYFANPGPDVVFNTEFFFHWADINNIAIKDWKRFTRNFLSIPMAHQLIGFYTIADKTDGILKVLRPYQYYAISAIVNRVQEAEWTKHKQHGGIVWHTTGSGKTISSYKAAELVVKTKEADKVIFLVDRIALDTQSKLNYEGFSTDDNVYGVDNTEQLISTLKDNTSHLIIASIQKLYRIKSIAPTKTDNSDGTVEGTKWEERERKNREADIEKINRKKLVFIVDECHRSTFGPMMQSIKDTFPRGLFFGFTGTPIRDENNKDGSTSADVFGDDLHSYVIGEAIRDKNVLGFDPTMILTFKDNDIKTKIALEKAKASTIEEVWESHKKHKIYDEIMAMPMASVLDDEGKIIELGIEDLGEYQPQYKTDEHKNTVVKSVIERFKITSQGGRYHAIFATSSIPEAIQYYRLIKAKAPELKMTVIIDPSDNDDIEQNGEKSFRSIDKINGINEIMSDYNARYGVGFKQYTSLKEDVLYRLAHKEQYRGIENDSRKNERLDMVIVVNQLLTGYDSKWINALFLDKVLEYENVIQAFSRTNRLCDGFKHFGLIYYYRKPHTMARNIERAVELYSGHKKVDVYVSKLLENLKGVNAHFSVIKYVFENEGIQNFSKLPKSIAAREKFALEFNEMNRLLEMAKVQDFRWHTATYTNDEGTETVTVEITEREFNTLLQRYKELFGKKNKSDSDEGESYPLDYHITEINTGKIDEEYLESRFKKYIQISIKNDPVEVEAALAEVSSAFAYLSEEEQKYANMFIHDIQNGNVSLTRNKRFKDYVADYMKRAQNDGIKKFATTFGINEADLRELILYGPEGMSEYGRKKKVLDQAVKNVAGIRAYFEAKREEKVKGPDAIALFDKTLITFVKEGGFEF